MADASMPVGESATPPTMMRPLCRVHSRYIVATLLRIPPEGEWRATLVVAQVLLFQAITADGDFHARCHGKTEEMSRVLAELGPGCCAVRESVFQRVCDVLRMGLTHAAQVSQRKIVDPNFDMTKLAHTLRKASKRRGLGDG